MHQQSSYVYEIWSVAVYATIGELTLHLVFHLSASGITFVQCVYWQGAPRGCTSIIPVSCAWRLPTKALLCSPKVRDSPCARSAWHSGRSGNGQAGLWRKRISACGNLQSWPEAVATPKAGISSPHKWSFTCRQKSRWPTRYLGCESFWKLVCVPKPASRIKL